MEQDKQPSELCQFLKKVLKDISNDSASFSSLDRERALRARLEDWLEGQRQMGKRLIKDMLQGLEIEKNRSEDAVVSIYQKSPVSVLSSDEIHPNRVPQTISNPSNWNPGRNDEDFFQFEESVESIPINFTKKEQNMQDVDLEPKEPIDSNEEDQEDDGDAVDSYLPSHYGSLPVDITLKHDGVSARKAITEKKRVGINQEKKFEPPHEYAARTFQETSDAPFDLPFSISTRKQSLI